MCRLASYAYFCLHGWLQVHQTYHLVAVYSHKALRFSGRVRFVHPVYASAYAYPVPYAYPMHAERNIRTQSLNTVLRHP